ncbi:tetratricopeptide repeat protein [Desulfovibrio mangrovi]|uniref:tetratricopeptide repeat protein n=1 Tax=Desulfovibrio mangrovi TaxID=2976983 RepID=UPI0022468CA9|nr:tetratricopeptide repeat protein [Desulfovibrio mangrovi]UZP67601.1 tetratricopeptide repeat protein [Desulfovibrio mangrovi]
MILSKGGRMLFKVLVRSLVILLLALLVACSSAEERKVELVESGNTLFEQGNAAEARLEAKNALKIDPKYAPAYVLLAKCSIREQNWRGAFGQYTQAVELAPDSIEAHAGLGQLYLLAGQYDKVEAEVQAMRDLQLDSLEANMLQAGLFIQTEKFTEAEALLSKQLKASPENMDVRLGLVTVYERRGEARKAETALQEALGMAPENKVLFYKAAVMATSQGKYELAEANYRKLGELVDDKPSIRRMIARVLEQAGEVERAGKEYESLLASAPDNVDFRIDYVGFLIRSKKWPEAEAVVQAGMKEDVNDIRLALAQADVLLAQRKIDEAKVALRNVTVAYADNPQALKAKVRLGEILLQERAYKDVLMVVNETGAQVSDLGILKLRGKAYLALGKLEEAAADLRIVSTKSPEDVEAHTLLAQAYIGVDNSLMAIEELHIALEKDPDYAPANMLLVKYYTHHGHWEKALALVGVLADRHPEKYGYQLTLGDIERVRGNVAAAEAHYVKAGTMQDGKAASSLKLGDMALGKKDYAKALVCYDAVLDVHADSAIGIERKMMTLLAMGRTDQAKAWGDDLLASSPDSAILYELMGRVALIDRKQDVAEAQFRKASELSPEWGVPYRRLMGIYLRGGKIAEAKQECLSALRGSPEALGPAFMLGQLYQYEGDKVKAEEIYRALLEKHPEFLAAANNLAYILSEAVDPARLNEGLDLAKLAVRDGSPESLDTLGWLHHKLGNWEQAIEALKAAQEKLPKNGAVAYHLVTALATIGKTDEAKRIGRNALKDISEFPEKKKLEELLAAI